MKPAAGRKTAAGFLFLSGGKDGDHEGLSADGADGKTDPVVDCFGGIIGDGEKLLAIDKIFGDRGKVGIFPKPSNKSGRSSE